MKMIIANSISASKYFVVSCLRVCFIFYLVIWYLFVLFCKLFFNNADYNSLLTVQNVTLCQCHLDDNDDKDNDNNNINSSASALFENTIKLIEQQPTKKFINLLLLYVNVSACVVVSVGVVAAVFVFGIWFASFKNN